MLAVSAQRLGTTSAAIQRCNRRAVAKLHKKYTPNILKKGTMRLIRGLTPWVGHGICG